MAKITQDKNPGESERSESLFGALVPPPVSPEMLEQARGKASAYEVLTGLPFEVRNGNSTAFDHSTDPGTVILGTEQLKQLGVTEPLQVDFACLHELGHFYELSHDPVGYRSVIAEGTRDDGLGQSYFRFYNALLDIYVNRNTLNRAPMYGDGDGGFSSEIRELYTQKLFGERDLTSLPKSTQYSYALLNIGMGVGDDLTLSPEVQKAIGDPLTYLGQGIPTKELIETYLVPAIGHRSKNEWRATVSERKSVIDRTLRKRFVELVEQDLKEGRDPNQGSRGGDIEGVEPSIEDLHKALKAAERIQREANKSHEERAADQREKAVHEEVREHLTEEEAKDFAETYRRVFPQIIEVAEILKEIVRQDLDHRKERIGFFRTGQEIAIPEVIEHFHTVQTNPPQAPVFNRDVYNEVITELPQHVRLWGVFDLSGSMSGDIKLVRDLSVVFSGAAQTLALGASREQHTLGASFGSIGYNDSAFEILPLTNNPTQADIAKSYPKLNAGGGTYEAPALRMVVDKLKNLDRNEGVVDIVIVVTDGDTSQEDESKQAIKALEELGAKPIAFQFSRGYQVPDAQPTEGASGVPAASPFTKPEPESGTFGRIWGSRGYAVRGVHQVVPAVRDGLRELLTKA